MVYNYKSLHKLGVQHREPIQIEWASDEQRLQFEYPAAPICASGGYGAAKTAGFILKIHYLCSIFPGMRWVIGRRKLTDLQKTTMTTFFKWCPPAAYSYGGRRSDADKVLRYNNGSEILWLHLDDPEVTTVIGGVEINGFLLDQAEEIEEEIFEKLMGRLGRWDQAKVTPELLRWWEIDTCGKPWPWQNPETGALEVPTYALLTCNPDAELHWIYRRFHPQSEDHDAPRGTPEDPMPSYKEQGYKMLFMDSTKNKFLSRQNIKIMLSNDASFIRRFVKGQWGIPEGQIHDIHKSSELEYTPELLHWLTNHCTLMRVLDHGDTAATCCTWWAIDQNGNMFCYREYYKPDTLISDHRKNIHAYSRDERYVHNIADPQIFVKTMQKHGGMWSVSEEYADMVHLDKESALHWTPGDNDEMGIRNRINEYLKWSLEHIHPITKERGSARMFFVKKSADYPEGCFYTIKQLLGQRREKIGTDLGRPIFSDERNKKIVDHAYDTVRYAIGSFAPPGKKSKAAQNPNSFDNVRRRAFEIEAKRGSREHRRAYRRRLGW